MKITLVRHEESLGNVLAKAASAAGSHKVETPMRGPDIPLSVKGTVAALDIVLPTFPYYSDVRVKAKNLTVSSPYLRAMDTACLAGAQLDDTDERLRDRDLGCLDGYTNAGIEALLASEHATRARMGKFYYRPAGGESWADVALRMRSFLLEKKLMGYDNLLVFSHDVPILCAIYICNKLSEAEILRFQKETPVTNGSITELEY